MTGSTVKQEGRPEGQQGLEFGQNCYVSGQLGSKEALEALGLWIDRAETVDGIGCATAASRGQETNGIARRWW